MLRRSRSQTRPGRYVAGYEGTLYRGRLAIYKSLVRPHLEYAVQVWNPTATHGNWQTILELENVQRTFTRMIDNIGLLRSNERLKELGLTTLLERRARGDLIETFKILSGNVQYGRSLFKTSRSAE